jgi:CheY-like chemotaxis protein
MEMHMHMLVVDDDPLIRELILTHFIQRGFVVYTATTGAEALSLMQRLRIDICIVDLQMPGMSGHELLVSMRAKTPLIRSIVVTGAATHHDVLQCLSEGAFSFVTKPLDDLEPLEQAVDQAVHLLSTWIEKLSSLNSLNNEVTVL